MSLCVVRPSRHDAIGWPGSVRPLPFSNQTARMSFSKLQRVFVVEYRLAHYVTTETFNRVPSTTKESVSACIAECRVHLETQHFFYDFSVSYFLT